MGPAYGPRPRLALDDDDAEKLLTDSLSVMVSNPRKRKALARWQIYSESYAELIKEKIDATHFDDEIKSRIYEYVDSSNNIALDITNSVCSVWKHSNSSHLYVEGATDAQNEALRQLIEESGFHRHARSWNREAFFLGPVTAIPVVRGERLVFDTLLPHFYDTTDNPEDMWGAPLAAAWDVSKPNGEASHLVQYGGHVTSILLDGETWRYYSTGDKGSFELLGTVPHGIGEFPGETLDFDISHGCNRWECDRHQRLVDATIKVGMIGAALGFVRKSQDKKLLTILGNLEGVSKGQTLDPEKPIIGRTQGPNQIAIDALDLDLDPENNIKHQAWVMQTIARSYGGQVASKPGSSSLLEAEVTFSHEALTEQRNEQIPFAKDFQRELIAKAVATCIQARHPLYLDLPSPEQIRAGLLVKYPPLSRSFASVDEQIKYNADGLSRGTLRYEDLLRPSMPGASEAELTAHMVANLKAQAPLIKMMTTRDQSISPVPVSETESQRNGKQGPEVRDSQDED